MERNKGVWAAGGQRQGGSPRESKAEAACGTVLVLGTSVSMWSEGRAQAVVASGSGRCSVVPCRGVHGGL